MLSFSLLLQENETLPESSSPPPSFGERIANPTLPHSHSSPSSQSPPPGGSPTNSPSQSSDEENSDENSGIKSRSSSGSDLSQTPSPRKEAEDVKEGEENSNDTPPVKEKNSSSTSSLEKQEKKPQSQPRLQPHKKPSLTHPNINGDKETALEQEDNVREDDSLLGKRKEYDVEQVPLPPKENLKPEDFLPECLRVVDLLAAKLAGQANEGEDPEQQDNAERLTTATAKAKSFLQKLTYEAQEQCRNFARHAVDREDTWGQWIAKGIGVAIGGGLAYAMITVFVGSLVYLYYEHENNNFLNEITSGVPNSYNNSLIAYVIITTIFDAVPRNANVLNKIYTFVWEEIIPDKRVMAATATNVAQKTFFCLKDTGRALTNKTKAIGNYLYKNPLLLATLAACIIPSLTEPFYLVEFQLSNMQAQGQHGLNTQAAKIMLSGCPFLFLDAFYSNASTAISLVTEEFKAWAKALHGWAQSTQYRFLRQVVETTVPYSPPTEEMVLREDYQGALETYARYLTQIPAGPEKETLITGLYQLLEESKANLKTQYPGLEKKELYALQGFLAMHNFIALGQQVEVLKRGVKSLASKMVKWVNGVCCVGGSLSRFIVPALIVETIFGLFTESSYVQIGVWSLATLGYIFQEFLEFKGIKELFTNYLTHEDPNTHGSHPVLRGVAKGTAAIVGTIQTFLLSILCIQASRYYFNSLVPMVSAPFYLFGEQATNVISSYNTHSQHMVTAFTDFYNRKFRKWVVSLFDAIGPSINALPAALEPRVFDNPVVERLAALPASIANTYNRKVEAFGRGPRLDYQEQVVLQFLGNGQDRLKTIDKSAIQMLKLSLESKKEHQ